MRRISIAVAFIFFASLAIAQQSAFGQSTSPTGIQPLATLSNCVTAQLGRIAVFTAVVPPNAQICNSGIYEPSPGTGPIGILNPNPVAAIDVNGNVNINTTSAYQIGESTVLYTGSPDSLSIFVGVGAGSPSSAGNENTFVGASAGNSNSSGGGNSFLGYQAGLSNLSGGSNSFVGMTAGYSNTSGAYNAFLGWQAGYANTMGQDNSFFGPAAGSTNTTGSFNVAVGANTGGSDDTNGGSNVFVGATAGKNNTSGGGNTFIGYAAGLANTSGSYNVFYGNSAGNYNTTGSSNVYIAAPGVGAESNTIRIGLQGTGQSQQNAAYIAGIYGVNVSGVPVQINAGGQLGAATSSLRFKEQVRDMGGSTDALMKLRPVTFLYKPEYADGERTLQYGLIAEEVAKVYPELVAYDNDGQPYSVRYQYLSTMLLNEVQKQYRRAEVQAEVIETQEQKISELEQRLSRLEKLVGTRANTAQTEPEHAKTSVAQ